MPATRAAYSNSRHRSSATRAAHASGHRSASDTPSSGRERRRQAKTRMLNRIAELEARVRVFMDIIAQLSTHAEAPPGLAQPEIFDVFDLTEEQASVACQTDISVDWSKPDVFVALPPSVSTAHADAAAGAAQSVAVGANEFDAITTGLRNLTIVSQDVGAWQALDDPNAKHQVSDMQYSQDLAEPCGPLPTCTSPVSVDAIAPTRVRDLGEQCGPLPNHTTPERFDPIAHTCLTSKVDISSQDVAEQCGSLPTGTSSVLDDGKAPICNAFKEDYISQDLAEQCGPQPSSPLQMMKDTVISPKHTTAPHPVESAPETRRTALSSRDEGAHPVESVPGNEADLQDAALHDNLDDRKLSKFHIITSSDAALHDNQDDRKPSKFHIITSSPLQDSTEHLHGDGKLALSSRDEPVHSSSVSEASVSVDALGPSALLVTSHDSPGVFGPSMRELHKPLKEYTLAVDPIIGAYCAYCRRRDPSLGHIRATATKVLRIAKKHGISKEYCCQHLQESSLALMTAASDLW